MLSTMLKRLSLLLLIVVLVAGRSFAAEDRIASKGERIGELVARYAKYGYLNGAVLVAEHGKIIYEKGVGEANMETHVANTRRTKFGIASLTKQFTATLVLQQVAEGRIRLDGRVSDYLPWYRKDTGERMTIEQVLHHTAGLPPDFEMPEFGDSEAAARHYEPQEFAEKFCQQNLVGEPGTKWAYSNCGYNLLGLILERATGKSFDDLLHEKLLEPLEMKDTGMDRNDLVRLGGAAGYTRHAGPRYRRGPYQDRIHFFAAGGMYSTAEDLFRWSEAFSGGGFVPKEIREQMMRPGINDWGYGWFARKMAPAEPGAGNVLVEMRGDMTGNYFSWILLYPEQNDVIIVLRNGYGSTERLEQNIQAILFDVDPKMPSRNMKDLAVQAWLVPEAWVETHHTLSSLFALFVAALIWKALRRRTRTVRV
jgi:CubicO group peptidase (beta-lactamase class C family)